MKASKISTEHWNEFNYLRAMQWQVEPPTGINFDWSSIILGSKIHPVTVMPYGPFMIVGFSYKRKSHPCAYVNVSNSIICTDFENSYSLN